MGKKEDIELHQSGKLPFRRTGHFFQHGPLAVHHLIVRKDKNPVLLEGIVKRMRETSVMITAENGILIKKDECIMHPAEVPLEIEAIAAF